MAKTDLPLTDTLQKNPEILFQLRQAFGILFDEDGMPNPGNETEVNGLISKLHSPEIGIPENFTVKETGIALEKWYETLSKPPEHETTMTGARESAVNANVAQGVRESQETERQRREAATVASEQKGEERAEEFINRQKERVERQKVIINEQIKKAEAADKKDLYVKARLEEAKLAEEQQKQIAEQIEKVKANPDKAINDLKAEIKSRVDSSIPDEAITYTAVGIVANIQKDYAPAKETAVAQEVKDKPEFDYIPPFADQSKSLLEMQQEIAKSAYGEAFQKTFLPDAQVEVAGSPQSGFTPMPNFLPGKSLEVLKTQNDILNDINPAREKFLTSSIDRYLAGYTSRGTQGQAFSENVSFSSFRRGPQANWEQMGGGPKLDAAAGIKEPLGLVSGLAKGVATKAVTKAITSKITTAVGGVAGGPVGAAIGATVSELVSRVLDSKFFQNAKKISAAIIGGLAFLVALPFGITAAVIAGLLATGVSMGLGAGMGSITLGSIGSGAASLIGAIGGATLAAIGGPILFILLGFPVIVAFILFIINSGAYIVPPNGLNPSSGVAVGGITIDIDCNNLDKSLNQSAYAAELIVCALTKAQMNPLTAGMTRLLPKLGKVLNQEAIQALALSAPVDGHLQCIGFVSATAGQAYGQNWGNVQNACSYANHAPSGYQYVSGTKGIKPGDIFVMVSKGGCSSGSPGHIGVVVSVDGVSVTCADANANGKGTARVARGCVVLSNITGYIRKK